MKTLSLLFSLVLSGMASAQSTSFKVVNAYEESPLVSFSQFETLADSVEKYRERRLISAEKFVAFSQEMNTVILDTRSKKFFDQKHIKGAINIPFADFTQGTLEAIIPDKNTRILIYCNNNFMADEAFIYEDEYFPSKESRPIDYDLTPFFVDSTKIKKLKLSTKEAFNEVLILNDFFFNKNYTLALNIPTFINLYGYGYQNIYELKDLIATSSSGDIQFEGSEVIPNDGRIGLISSQPTSPLVNFTDLQELTDLVKPHRQERLISLDEFNQMKLDANTIILDARSKEMYDAKHIKGAIHLEFSEFTQATLDSLLKDKNKRILIYCNNNFISDLEKQQQDKYFMSKVSRNPPKWMTELTLALNIPTYINLYGYGYQNVYELNELVVTSDSRIEFEGTSIN